MCGRGLACRANDSALSTPSSQGEERLRVSKNSVRLQRLGRLAPHTGAPGAGPEMRVQVQAGHWGGGPGKRCGE